METFSRITGPLCGKFTGLRGEFPSQRPVTRSFDVFFHLCLNKRLSKHRGPGDLRRNCSELIARLGNGTVVPPWHDPSVLFQCYVSKFGFILMVMFYVFSVPVPWLCLVAINIIWVEFELSWKKWWQRKMAAIWQTTFSAAFWIYDLIFRFEVHRRLFPCELLTINQHWFEQWANEWIISLIT